MSRTALHFEVSRWRSIQKNTASRKTQSKSTRSPTAGARAVPGHEDVWRDAPSAEDFAAHRWCTSTVDNGMLSAWYNSPDAKRTSKSSS